MACQVPPPRTDPHPTPPGPRQAPDPWLAIDGQCRGYETRSVAALDFCGYWDSTSNPEGADAETRRELLDAGPVCLDKEGKMLTCSANSTRTQRAGVYEMAYAARPDRAFCSFPFFRSRMTAEATTSEECREALLDRNQSCYTGCDTCTTVCTNPGLRGVASAWRCSAGQPLMGTFAASVSSDAGFDMRTRHGADRRKGTPPIPSSIWKEQYDVLIQNDLRHPRVPRDSISCRKAHLTDSFGAYVSPIDSLGRPVKRSGFHVHCTTSSQCHSRCGEHPILGESYVCVRNAKLFSYQGVYENGTVYYINEPGDDAFDVVNTNLTAEHLGTCMDTRYDTCSTPDIATVSDPPRRAFEGTTTSILAVPPRRAPASPTESSDAPAALGGPPRFVEPAWSASATTSWTPASQTRRSASRAPSWRAACSTGRRSRR